LSSPQPSPEGRGRRNLIIGIGNLDRGDDAIGLLSAQRIKSSLGPSVAVIESTGDGTVLMDLWTGYDFVRVIDAAHEGHEPGTVLRFDACRRPLPTRSFCCSTHAFGLAQGIELARQLNELPEHLIVYGIVGRNFDLGTSPAPEVQAAGVSVADEIIKALGSHGACVEQRPLH
jgi:hydrogenase maturation protease